MLVMGVKYISFTNILPLNQQENVSQIQKLTIVLLSEIA